MTKELKLENNQIMYLKNLEMRKKNSEGAGSTQEMLLRTTIKVAAQSEVNGPQAATVGSANSFHASFWQ